MREIHCAKRLHALVVASVVVSWSAAGGEPRREQVILSAQAWSQEEDTRRSHEVWREEGVLSLRVVDPGRLVVKAGSQILAASALGWGEDRRLRVDALEGYPPTLLPRVLHLEPGREEVEVHVPARVDAGELLTLTYSWDWKHAAKPPLVRTWMLTPSEQDFTSEDDLSEPESSEALEDEADAPALSLMPAGPLPVHVDPARPESLLVPAYASREELAARLFGESSAVNGFDWEPCEVAPDAQGSPRACVRVRQPQALQPELLATVRGALEAQLAADVAWTASRLTTPTLDKAGAVALVERSLRWSQCSDVVDGSGQSYFDRYLQALAAHRDEPPRWTLGDTLTQDWHFLGEASEPLQKAIALRSKRWRTRYTVTDGAPTLAPGSVVGRFYFADGTSVQVRLLMLLTEERSLERAELRVRNLSRSGPSVLIAGEDGRWRGYSADFGVVEGAPEPLEHPEGHSYWYYPGTLLVRPGDWRLRMTSGRDELATLRREIRDAALAAATPAEPQPLLGLELDVLALLTPEERQGVFDTLLMGPALGSSMEEDAVHLLERVVLATPAQEFPALERELTSSGVLEKLLACNAPGKVQLGRAFTQKALASLPLVLDSLDSLPTFHLGREGETTHLLNVPSGLVPTTWVAPEAWDARQGVRLGAEPAPPGEVAGPSTRMALYFEPVRQHFQARYLSSVEKGARSRALHPLEWVRVEVHGQKPATHLVTAMELALMASVPDTTPVWAAVGRISELHMVYGAVSAWARTPLMAGGAGITVSGGTVVMAPQAAVLPLVGRLSLVAGLAGVDIYRDELSRTPEGRAFLAVQEVALLAMAGRDISKLATSGIWRELVQAGGRVLNQSGARASTGLRDSVEMARALARTLERMLTEEKAVATPEGLRFLLPGGAEAFKQAYFAIRGEMAAARALGLIRGAGLEAQAAEKTLDALKSLAAESQEMARAYSAVARRAAALPADKAQTYLAAVESLRASSRSAVKSALVELSKHSGAPSLADPIAFLKDAQWLVGHPELDVETVGTLAKKACEGSIDLGWLRSTGLALDDLNFMARDKKTPWKLFQGAAANPADWAMQRRAREQLRGIVGEMVTERNAQKLFPGYRLTGRQVKLEGGHIIDHELTSTDGLRLRHGAEVKGWNENRWRKALDAWEARQQTTPLDKDQQALVEQLQRLLDQLADAAKAPRGRPFLVSTDRLSGPTRLTLNRFLSKHAPDVLLIQVEEAKILEKTKQLRAALRLPEELSGGVP